jgi:hypothetical protein
LFLTQRGDALAVRRRSVAGPALNRAGHSCVLADPEYKSGVRPNNDTLHSNVTFDLGSGPCVVETPDFGDRYYAFSIAHPATSTTESYGSRTHGSKLPALFVHSPDYAGP